MSIVARLRQQARRGQLETWAEIDGTEHNVTVEYSIEPAEPDVGYYGGLVLESVWFEDEGDIMGQMTENELDCLADRVQYELDDRGDPADGYGDWLHDCARDDKLTGDR